MLSPKDVIAEWKCLSLSSPIPLGSLYHPYHSCSRSPSSAQEEILGDGALHLLSPERRRRSQVLLGRILADASSIDDEDGNHDDDNAIEKLSLRVLSQKRELLLDNMESLNRLLVSERLAIKCLFTKKLAYNDDDDDDDLDSDCESDLED
jgi:hypothetical protein